MTQFFINNKEQLVNEAIEGAVLTSPWQNLEQLDIDPHIRIVVRRDWDKSKVAIISGGGSGHEPAHVGFVGKNMLTAAVCGDVFASPSVDAVFNAIVQVTGDAGCLLIVKNYTGDRLNFGLAAEKAKRLGYQVEMVMVSDDIALPDNKQPRGVAGTLFVHKVAGYAAEQGQSLVMVAEAAQVAIQRTASIGVALSSCHLPGETHSERVAPGHAELGLGIHGEPGVSVLATQNSRDILAMMIEKLLSAYPLTADDKVAVLLNNLGGVSNLEMSLLTRDLCHSSLAPSIQYLVGPAPLMTALDMKGFSLSLLHLNPQLETALLAPTEVSSWPTPLAVNDVARRVVEKQADQLHYQASEHAEHQMIVNCICQTLIDNESELNRLDSLVGDGDTGSTFAAGARQIYRESQANQLPFAQVDKLLGVVGERLATVMGGSSGVLLSIFFTTAGQQMREGQPLASALVAGLNKMKQYGGAELGDRTMIDALQPALEALVAGQSLTEAASAAEQGSASTALMNKANAGRSSYLASDSLSGVKDPGAVAVESVFAALTKLNR
ncbi:dihydroxyacetone kinase subunit DhaK [Vibrio metschnikovii]|nr:dihydroxyacetone kinase subunit DhaK [Vibrio metschnikovii]EKO3890322.1 dihydroxyacetone kinase subunit DhaK [Vibrio metschnikovii]